MKKLIRNFQLLFLTILGVYIIIDPDGQGSEYIKNAFNILIIK